MMPLAKTVIPLVLIAGNIAAEQTITLRPGQTHRIALEMTAGTGYKWVAKPLNMNAPIEIIQEGTEKPRRMIPGASSKQFWVIKALKPIGKRNHAELTLEYKRMWEKDVRPSKVEKYDFYVQ